MKVKSFKGALWATEAITVPEGGSVAVMLDTGETNTKNKLYVKKTTGRGVLAVALVHTSVAASEQIMDYTLITSGEIVPCYSAEAIAIGERVCFDSSGYALDWDTASDIDHGIALTAATGASQVLLVQLTGAYTVHA